MIMKDFNCIDKLLNVKNINFIILYMIIKIVNQC